MSVRVLCGDAIERLRELPEGSVHCCVTSVPYWGLRQYIADGAPEKPFEIGLEPTPDAWAARLVEVFREVKRVLRPDGVVFCNVGDSYCSGTTAERKPGNGDFASWTTRNQGPRTAASGDLKPKDLIGQPWLLAFALRADGWWLRSEIIWSKPNPMPESVTDRPTKAHEQVFLLTKGPRYFYDAEAVREAQSETPGAQAWRRIFDPAQDSKSAALKTNGFGGGQTGGGANRHPVNGRNLRSVWQIATEPLTDEHYAAFPREIPRRAILASTSAKGCCPACGAPWARVVERGESSWERRKADGAPMRYGVAGHQKSHGRSDDADRAAGGLGVPASIASTGWRPSCTCEAGAPIPATILDCFAGSGTTGVVADELGRDAILIELSPAFAEMAERRVTKARARRMLGDAPRYEPLPGQASLFERVPAA